MARCHAAEANRPPPGVLARRDACRPFEAAVHAERVEEAASTAAAFAGRVQRSVRVQTQATTRHKIYVIKQRPATSLSYWSARQKKQPPSPNVPANRRQQTQRCR